MIRYNLCILPRSRLGTIFCEALAGVRLMLTQQLLICRAFHPESLSGRAFLLRCNAAWTAASQCASS